MFNSPLHFCRICKQHIALDQTQAECAQEQHCHTEHCPLSHLFVRPGSVENKESGKPTEDVHDVIQS